MSSSESENYEEDEETKLLNKQEQFKIKTMRKECFYY